MNNIYEMNKWRPSKELLDLIEEIKRLYSMLDKLKEEWAFKGVIDRKG